MSAVPLGRRFGSAGVLGLPTGDQGAVLKGRGSRGEFCADLGEPPIDHVEAFKKFPKSGSRHFVHASDQQHGACQRVSNLQRSFQAAGSV